MASNYRLSEDIVFAFTSPSATDVGGTTAATAWTDMSGHDRGTALVELGTWNAADDLDHLRIEQAQDSSGTNSKELTTDASGGDYDTDAPLDADGDQGIIEWTNADLDADGGFTHVRLVVGEDGNTGVDDVIGVLILSGARDKYAQRQGAASASRVYVTPS